MDVQTVINMVGTVLYLATCLLGTASVAVHFRVAWYRSTMGRHLMAYMGALALTLDLGLAKLLLGDSLGFQIARLAAFAAIPLVMGQRLYLQVQAQRTERAARDADRPPSTSDGTVP